MSASAYDWWLAVQMLEPKVFSEIGGSDPGSGSVTADTRSRCRIQRSYRMSVTQALAKAKKSEIGGLLCWIMEETRKTSAVPT